MESATNPMFLGTKSPAVKAPSAEEDNEDAQAQLEAIEAADAITAMRDPPASWDMWLMYKEKYEELAETVDDLQKQIESAPPGLRAGPKGPEV